MRFSGSHSFGSWLSVAAANLRLSGSLYWEANLAGRLNIEEQVVIGEGLVPTEVDGRSLGAIPHQFVQTGEGVGKALDQRTLVMLTRLGATAPVRLHIFDTWNKRQAALITPPAQAKRSRFGSPQDSDFTHGNAVAVWHDAPETAWLFVGSPEDADPVENNANVGGMYIYRLDWRQDPLAVELVNTLRPPLSEAGNRWGTNHTAYYGSSLTISADGGTLAVAAHQIDSVGAIYVYTRPSGEGRDWGDLDYADGVKVTTVQTATWGMNAGTAPFNGGALSTCDAYCSKIWADQRTDLGRYTLGLSADGRVLAAGADGKDYASSTPGGQFIGANQRTNRGEAYVWLAPAGGWEAAPRVSESGKTLIAAKSDASNFNPARHYSPGPDRRVEQPDAVLLALPWDNASSTEQRFGRSIAVSPDGSTVAVSLGRPGHVYIFQRNSASDWDGVGEPARSAALTDLAPNSSVKPGDEGGMAFSRDGRTLAVGVEGYNPSGSWQRHGAVLLFSPAGALWSDATRSDARILEEPGGSRPNAKYAFPLYGLSGQRMATSSKERSSGLPLGHGRAYLSDGGCTVRMADGVGAWTCPIEIDDSSALVPPGTPEGVFTLSAEATLSVNGAADSAIVLKDQLEVTIGEVKQVAELKLGFATDRRDTVSTGDDRPYPSTLERGQATTLRLQILSERGLPAEGGSLESVLFSATGGALSTMIGGGCQGGDGGLSCPIDVSELNAGNNGQILVTLRHTGQAGPASVSASVISKTAESLAAEPLALTLAGPAAAISVAAPTAGVLNINAESAEGAEADGTDTDHRDRLTLAVTAADASGNKVALPVGARTAWVLAPDGERITSGIRTDWPLGGRSSPTLNGAGDPLVRVDINRALNAKLANGEYTLRLRAGELIATRSFSISGDPAAVELGEPQGSFVENGQFTISATVRDADDAAVPDGTRVSWEVTPLGEAAVLVQLSADAATKAGRVSATYLNVSEGQAYVRATAGEGGVNALKLVTISAAAQPLSIAEQLGLRTRNGINTWLGAEPIAASALVEALPRVSSLRAWVNGAWVAYIIAPGGRVAPGSFDFTLQPGAIIWLTP